VAEPKRATCIFCGIQHFNVYSELCEACRLVEGVDFPLSSILGLKDPYSDKQMWQLLLQEILFYLEWKLNPPNKGEFNVTKD